MQIGTFSAVQTVKYHALSNKGWKRYERKDPVFSPLCNQRLTSRMHSAAARRKKVQKENQLKKEAKQILLSGKVSKLVTKSGFKEDRKKKEEASQKEHARSMKRKMTAKLEQMCKKQKKKK